MSAASADGLFYSHASLRTINTEHTLNSYLCYFLDIQTLAEIIAQEWVFIVSWHCHQMFHIFFYLKLVKNAKIGNFWGYPHSNLATLWNLVILAISATLPDGSNSKSPKIGQKRQNQQFLGEIHTQIWWRFWFWI